MILQRKAVFCYWLLRCQLRWFEYGLDDRSWFEEMRSEHLNKKVVGSWNFWGKERCSWTNSSAK